MHPLLPHLSDNQLLLGSQSPRRKELLSQMGFTYKSVSIDCEESFDAHLKAADIPKYLSQKKSAAYTNLQSKEILLTADTIVWLDNTILEKPQHLEEAAYMLQQLSGKTHTVYSAFTLKSLEKSITKVAETQVQCMPFSEAEIQYYISHYEVMDKAGGYAIQDFIGLAKIQSIQGSFFTVMGLPTHLVYEELQKW